VIFGRRRNGAPFSPLGGDTSAFGAGRRRRTKRPYPRAVALLFSVALGAGIVALWVWAFAPIFVEPQEFHARQRRFDRAVREVLQPVVARAGGGAVPDLPDWPPPLGGDRAHIVACAEAQVARGVRYTPSYHPIDFPWGDIAPHLATSVDLVIRCIRDAGLDLQQLVAIDRKATPKNYPLNLWSSRRPDRSIDHRRLPNLYAFAKLFFPAASVEVETPAQAADFLPGDLVFWSVGGSRGFPGLAGIVIDRRGPDGIPWVVTLVPSEQEATLHHRVNDWPLQAHFRVDIDLILERFLEANPGAVLVPRPPRVPGGAAN